MIQLDNQRRSYSLPRFLAFYRAGRVTVEDGWLRIAFEPAGREAHEPAGV